MDCDTRPATPGSAAQADCARSSPARGCAAGVGSAVPTNMVQQAVPEPIASGDYTYPWLGIEGRDLFPADVVAVDLPVRQGALVITVTQDSQADAPT